MIRYIAPLIFLVANAQAATISDFSWIPASSTSATTTLDDGTIFTLESNPIQFDDLTPDGLTTNSARIFSLTDPRPSEVTLRFDRLITDIRLKIIDLDPSAPEYLDGFSTALSSVDGFLLLNSGVVTSSQDNSGGNLMWNGLNDKSVSFIFNRCAGCGLYLEEVEISAVPLPTAAMLFPFALGGLIPFARKKA